MQSVSSNAVAQAIEPKVEWIAHFDKTFTNITQSQQEQVYDLGEEYPSGYCVSTCLFFVGSPPSYWTHLVHCYNSTDNNRKIHIFMWCNSGTCPEARIQVNVFKREPQ